MVLNKDITHQLQNYYNHQARKYAHTRRKFWVEKKILKISLEEYLITYRIKKLKILEFGCGDGRFLREVLLPLSEKENIVIEYIGVDISQWLLDIAQEQIKQYWKSISTTFICADILDYISNCKQEEFDCVVGMSSFQHIQTYEQRLYLMQYFYKVLKYDGIIMMLNWSFSYWFLQKYWKAILWWIGRYFTSFWKQDWNSMYLPWKAKDQIFDRFYHIFLLKEFRKLVLFSSFVIKQLGYIDQQWRLVDTFSRARSIFFIAQKSVLG